MVNCRDYTFKHTQARPIMVSIADNACTRLNKNLADAGMVCTLADNVHKQEVPCTQWYALHNLATLFNNHPYISSSKFSTNATGTPLFTYVGMVRCCRIMWPWYMEYILHITVCMALLVCVHTYFAIVSQVIHSAIDTSARFLLWINLFMEIVFFWLLYYTYIIAA